MNKGEGERGESGRVCNKEYKAGIMELEEKKGEMREDER